MRCPWISVKSRNSERLLGWRNLRWITARSLFAQWRRHQSTIGWYQLFYLVLPLAPFQSLQQRFMHSFVFSTFQSNSPMITSQTTCMVKRWGRYSFNTHGTILKSSWGGRRLGGQLSIATGLNLQGHSTSLKAQYLPSASTVSQLRFIYLFTVYDATFQRFLMLHVKLGAVL